MKGKISIIVPIYHVEEFLPACIDSILAQTYRNFELILVNDGSPDRCGDICDWYAEQDERIKVIHKENGGVSSARNVGIEAAEGEFIAFLDPDDTVEPRMYEKLAEAACVYEAELVVCPFMIHYVGEGRTMASSVWQEVNCVIDAQCIKEKLIPSMLMRKSYGLVSVFNKLYRRSLFTSTNLRFDENRSHGEDTKLNFLLLLNINRLVFLDQPLCNYYVRNRETSLTHRFRENFFDYIADDKKYLADIMAACNLEHYADAIRKHYAGVTLMYLQSVVASHLPDDAKLSLISKIMNDQDFSRDVAVYPCPSAYFKLLKWLCMKRKARWFQTVEKTKTKIQSIL